MALWNDDKSCSRRETVCETIIAEIATDMSRPHILSPGQDWLRASVSMAIVEPPGGD
jgi:hypothetical protein